MLENKERSKIWKLIEENGPQKFKEHSSVGKELGTIFWDQKGVLLAEYRPSGSTVIVETYFETLMNARKAIKEKRCGKLSRKIVLIHDHARPHVANLLASFKWDFFLHLAYSADLAGSDFYLFTGFKRELVINYVLLLPRCRQKRRKVGTTLELIS